MTWKEFKTVVEAGGVGDEDEVDYIDVSPLGSHRNDLTVAVEDDAARRANPLTPLRRRFTVTD